MNRWRSFKKFRVKKNIYFILNDETYRENLEKALINPKENFLFKDINLLHADF